MRSRVFLLILLLSCLPFSPLNAAPGEGKESPLFGGEYRVQRITPEEGLPHSMVYSLLVDSRGFIWAGTRDGLTRYDGYSFITYWEVTTPLRVLAEDRSGNIWAGTPEQLCRLDRKSGTFVLYRNDPSDPTSLSHNNIFALLTDRNGTVWAGTENGLNSFDPATNSFVRYLWDPVERTSIVSLLEDHSGGLWAGTYRSDRRRTELFRRPPGGKSFLPVPLPEEINRRYNQPLRMFMDGHGYICMIAYQLGTRWNVLLMRIDPVTGELVDTVPYVHSSWLYGALFYPSDSTTTGWIAQRHSPLTHILPGDRGKYLVELSYNSDGTHLTGYSPIYPPVFPNQLQGLHTDHAGLVWACSDDGLFKIVPSSFFFPSPIRINTPEHSRNTFTRIRTIRRDRGGTLWIGTDNELLQCDPATGKMTDRFSEVNGDRLWQNRAVNEIFEDPPHLLIGTNRGLFRFDPRTGESAPYNSDVEESGVRALARDRKGNLWVGSMLRLSIYSPDNRLLYREALGPTSRHLSKAVWDLLCDSKGRMWGGTETGLYRWDSTPGQPRFYTHRPEDPHSIPRGAVWTVHEDLRGNIWVGVYGGGLARYRPETDDFVTIGTDEGLPSNGVCAILNDNAGNLWISTSNGLACYDVTANRMLTYTTSDGLAGTEFALKAAWRDPDGVLYFGGVNQVTRFDPSSLRKNSHVPPLIVTSFRANDSLISVELLDGDSVKLNYRQNHLAVEFAALDYLNPKGNMYAFKLEGVDKEWNYAGNRRYAGYSDVDPGSYVLHIRGSNSHGVWSYRGIRIYVIITPPIWQRLWFHALAAGSALSILFFWYRGRQRRRREREERRIIEAKLQALRLQMKPHFLFNALNSIHSFILLHKSDEASAYLSKFARLMRIALYHSEHSFISLQDEAQFLQLYLELEAVRFDAAFTYTIGLPDDLPPASVRLPSMLVQPYVENAIHHGLRNRTEGRLEIRFERRGEDMLVCTIEDNGVGRKAANAVRRHREGHHSMGTGVTQQRLELLNSIHEKEFLVEIVDLYHADGTAAGTRVRLRIPLQRQSEKG